MVNIKEQVEAEIENIENVLSKLPESSNCSDLSMLELGGVATLLHNFYNGIENIIKQILLFQKIDIPTGPSWHREIINLAVSKEIIENSTAKQLQEYLAFRHFFVHTYVLDLRADRVAPLVKDAKDVFLKFSVDIKKTVH